MAATAPEPNRTQEQLDALTRGLESGTFANVRHMLNALPPVDIAKLLESSPPPTRALLWQLVDDEAEGEVIQGLGDELQSQFLKTMDVEEVAAVTEGLEADDMADILQRLPEKLMQQVLSAMDQQDRARVEQVLEYPEQSAGGLMNTDTITVRARHTADVVLRYLRRHYEIPAMTDSLIVVNRSDRFLGVLPLRALLVADPAATVREIMETDVAAIPADTEAVEVSALFERNGWVSAPVIDADGKLLGRITIDDVVDVIREEAEHSLMSMAGLDEDEDTFAPVFKTTPRRALWLGINLVTAFIAASVINLFQGTIDKVVALAVLMPVVASMGGIAGTQTLTVMVRGIALGQIGLSNQRWLVNRELLVGLLNGMLWSVVVAAVASLWFADWKIGGIIAVAMVINLVTAGVAGTLIPLAMKRYQIDPALAGGVVLTTVTDVVGFMSFLGLATWVYG
ncbi:MAG: magnesium transporter [Pseudomonadota bacterium]